VLLVLQSGRSTRPQAVQAAELLSSVQARMLGVVLGGVGRGGLLGS
jgi:hypothetical protein